jgi:phage-related protein
MKRTFVYWGEHFEQFIFRIEPEVREKVFWILGIIETSPKIPGKFFKHIAGANGLFEIRIEWESNAFRIFCFFEPNNIIVLCNGFVKKTQKTPTKELLKALKIMKEYYDEKEK